MFFSFPARPCVRRASVAVRRRTVRSCPSRRSIRWNRGTCSPPGRIGRQRRDLADHQLRQPAPDQSRLGARDGPGRAAVVLNASGDPSRATRRSDDGPPGQPVLERPRPRRPADEPERHLPPQLQRPGQPRAPNIPAFSTPFTVQNQAYNAATNTTTVDLVVPSNNWPGLLRDRLQLQTQATATSAINTGFSNAKLIRPGYAADSTQLYTNEFLSALKPFSVAPLPGRRRTPTASRPSAARRW